jgi:hypothetical protein
MSNEYIINPATSDIIFGTDAAGITHNGGPPVIGYCQSASAETGSDMWECRDGTGAVVTTVNYNTNGQLQCSFYIAAGAPLPVPGDRIGVGQKVGVIQTVSQAWANQEGCKLDITGKWYAGITLA